LAKKKRVWYSGAVYHITNRGNRRSDIFKDEEDYQVYLTILKQQPAFFKIRVVPRTFAKEVLLLPELAKRGTL
jgi:REP element-mobilizing transposase RayT